MSNYLNIDPEKYAEVFKALSNPNRLRIFIRLASCCAPGTIGYMEKGSTAYVGQLSADLAVGKSTVSHHLKELKRVGLLKMERRGQRIACWVDPKMVAMLRDFFDF